MAAPVSGHVREVKRKSGAQWYMKYRLPNGRQVQKRLGPAWAQRSRPPAGYFTRRMAEERLREALVDAQRGTGQLPATAAATFADLSAEWLREAERERSCKHSTLTDYRLIVRKLDEEFGDRVVTDITPDALERWLAVFLEGRSNRTGQKYLTVLHGILAIATRRWGIRNATDGVRRPRVRSNARIDFFSPEEVWALVRKAKSEQDAAIFLTAAFTGLRMGELLALRWGRVDFARQSIRVERGYTLGKEDSPKSNRERAVPMAPEVAQALAKLAERDAHTADGDLVFCGTHGGHLSAQKLRDRYAEALDAASLRRLRFHDLRHTFGSIAINRASAVQVKTWMGHADLKTTERYLHFKERSDDAELLADAFRATAPDGVPNVSRTGVVQA